MAEETPPRGRRRRWVRLVVAGAAVLTLAGGGVIAWAVTRSASEQESYATATVATQTLKETVSSTGTFEPAQRADLSFGVSSTVTAVKVAVGDTVTKGQTLATVDATSLKADVASAEAGVEAAEDQLTTVSDASDSTDAQIASAKAQVTLKKSQLVQAETELTEATLRSSISGVVAAVGLAVGDRTGSSSADQSTSGSSSSAQVTVINTDAYVVAATVGTAYRAQITKGLQVAMIPTGTTDTVYGTVSSVGVMATAATTGATATIPVTIKVTGKPKNLFPGATAAVTITVRQRTDVLAVPTAAISTNNGATVVRRLTGGTPTEVPVTIGQVYGAQTEITAGLAAGDQVVIATRALPAGVPTGRGGRQGGFGEPQGQGSQAPQGAPGGLPAGADSQGGR